MKRFRIEQGRRQKLRTGPSSLKTLPERLPAAINKNTKRVRLSDHAEIIHEDDLEIARLEKLLGIDSSKDKASSAAKLNREYEQFEGITGGFGDFLLSLDSIGVTENHLNSNVNDVDEDFAEIKETDHLIDDDEQELSDIGGFDESGSDAGSVVDDMNHDIEEIGNFEESSTKFYTPAPGEDIYGRIIDESQASQSTGKYIPPAARKKNVEVDLNSDTAKILVRQINGLMNRLSDQTKDSILIDFQGLYKANSSNIVNNLLKANILNACSIGSQSLVQIIPLYAALIACLSLTVSVDVGSFLTENLVMEFVRFVDSYRTSITDVCNEESGVKRKTASNYLLIAIYLYNFRVFHHQLMIDIINKLSSVDAKSMKEYDIEYLLLVINHCGFQLRADDPIFLRTVILKLFSKKTELSADNSAISLGGRYQYMLEALTDLKNNKSRRSQSIYLESVKNLRKWMGSVKSRANNSRGSIISDKVLHISLQDLIDADTKGRWWKAGASWKGNSEISNEAVNSKKQPTYIAMKTDKNSDIAKIEKLAEKLRLNTSARKNILFAIVGARDIHDAFERISKLDLKGRQDRDVVKVIIECCGMETNFNPFYGELVSMFCEQNRQFKTTLQYTYWDLFREMAEGSNNCKGSKILALSKLLAHLVKSFHVPLAVFRVIDMSTLNSSLTNFLEAFFLELFRSKITEETFSAIFERVATSADFDQTRDTVLLYLKTAFKLSGSEEVIVKDRKKKAMSILHAMRVLDVAVDSRKQMKDY